MYLTQRLSLLVLAQDALLLAYAAVMIRSGLRARKPESEQQPRAEEVPAGRP